MSQTPFSNLKLQAGILQNLASLNYTMMTPIQAESLPHILTGKDVIAQSKTGSGKTAAFGLGLLENLDITTLHTQALVLCPTRELADQVARELRKLARNIANVKIITLCGGMPMYSQQASLRYGAHIIVGTPGRIEDHLKRGTLKLNQLQILVLDEADRMLEMGFQLALDSIVKKLPEQRQTLLFSATFQKKTQAIAKRMMRQPITVKVAVSHDNKNIAQCFYQVEHKNRLEALRLLLLQQQPESSIVFCNTKRETEEVTNALIYAGFSALALNGDLEQRERDQAIIRFANRSISILVATDVAARGLDIDALDLVINYELAHEPETHTHRIGRTGRAGKQGLAYSLFGTTDNYKMTVLSDYLQQNIQASPLPSSKFLKETAKKAAMTTLQISGGKKHKLRPGDILGALTADNDIAGAQVGRINIMDQWAYVAVNRTIVSLAVNKLGSGKLKGRSFRISVIGAAS
ncbi:MAG: ATP-dependent RNA helicase DbpA [Mariprofundaceae bacterium]|nr:ATP-dependent RNA helicase DbpA [Mariprofundaceae bacterium]